MSTQQSALALPSEGSIQEAGDILSRRVLESEAKQFQTFSEGLQKMFGSGSPTATRADLECKAAVITELARRLFGPNAVAKVQGSVRKGTEWRGSDVDILLHTPKATAKEEREKLVELVRADAMFHPKHVRLGKLAIHVKSTFDFDVVCCNTVEFGERSKATAEFDDKLGACNAVRAFKFMTSYVQKRKVPGYFIELLVIVLYNRSRARGDHLKADGSMPLVVDTLQSIVDGSAPLCDESWGKIVIRELEHHARCLLHVFVASRFYLSRGWRDCRDVQSWLQGISEGDFETEAGPVPCWLIDPEGAPAGRSTMYPHALEMSVASTRNASDPKNLIDPQVAAVKLLMNDSSLARYTLVGSGIVSRKKGHQEPPPTPPRSLDKRFFSELQELRRLTAEGSDVARRMLQARMTWLEGQQALDEDHDADAINSFAAALRLSIADGDPFSGWWWPRSGSNSISCYLEAAASVLRREPDSVDVRLVRAVALLHENRYDEAETKATAGLKINSSDAYGCLAFRGTIRGNRSLWVSSLKDWEKAVDLVPEEPIFSYWQAVCRNKMLSDSANLDRAIADYNKFLSRASPEGRKYSEAKEKRTWHACVICVKRQSEAGMLPVFKELDSDAKKMVLRVYKVLHLAQDGGAASPRSQTALRSLTRQEVNEIYNRGDYMEAIACYTELLKTDPYDYLVLANRSAACSKLGLYSEASADAEAVVRLKPEWVKGKMRLAQAEIGRLRFDIALKAADEALVRDPSNADLRALRSTALAGLEKLSSVFVKCDPKSLDCWGRVMFKSAVRVVDPAGGADFVTLSDALHACRHVSSDDADGWTIILRPGVYDLHAVISHSVSIQLLGETVAGLASNNPQPGARLLCGAQTVKPHSKRSHHPLIGVGMGSTVYMENLSLCMKQNGGPDVNCLGIEGGASVTATNCVFFSSISPCVGLHGAETRCTLRACLFTKGTSAGVVADAGATLRLEKCRFRECQKAAVEIRGPRTSARLSDCKFRDCRRQAVVLYGGSKRLEMEDCEIFRCGAKPSYSALLIGGDATMIRKCVFTKNQAEAVVTQGADGSVPFISMDECQMTQNGSGLLFGMNPAWGILSRNRVEDNAGGGVVVAAVATGRKITFRDNKIVRNGPGGKKMQFDVAVISDLTSQLQFTGNIPARATLRPRKLLSVLEGKKPA